MKQIQKILLSSLLALAACAPTVEERDFGTVKKDFGPRTQDVDLTSELQAFSTNNVALQWQGVIASETYFRQAENLFLLGQALQDPSFSEKGTAWLQAFYQQPQVTSFVDLSKSPFAVLAATYTQNEVLGTLQEVSADIDKSRADLNKKVLALGKSYPWPAKPTPLGTALEHAQNFTQSLLKNINQMSLPELVRDGVTTELKLQTKPLFNKAQEAIRHLDEARTLSQTLRALDQSIAAFAMALPAEFKTSLQKGRTLAKSIDAAKDAQGGLTVLIDVWRILNAKDRVSYFKPVSTDLYDFLSKQSEKDLDCLRQEGCSGGLFKGIAKKLFILPEIKKYGIEKLQHEMNEKTKLHVLEQIRAYAHGFLQSLPKTIAEKMDAGIAKEAQRLTSVKKDYPSFLSQLLSDWGKNRLPMQKGRVYGFEVSNIKIQLQPGQALSLQAASTLEDLKGPTAGTSMTAHALLLGQTAAPNDFAFQSALSQINKLISIGGYRDPQDRLVPALLSPVGQEKKPLDLMNLSANLNSYRIPDKIKLRDGFHAHQNMIYEKDFSASSYADQIKGLSEMLKVTADWKSTSYDHLLGQIKAQELTEDLQAEALNRPLFPKDMLFALNVADVAVLLQDITKNSTPVFLVNLQDQIVWADQYNPEQDTVLMGGIVDIKKGKKSNIVRSKDVAHFLIAVATFLEATEGIERTQAPLLLEKDAEGKRPLDTLLQGRADLKLLIVAMANFISNQLTSEKSLVQNQYYLHEMLRSNNPDYVVEDQVIAIRALMKAYALTGIDAYQWSAQDIYFAMNRTMFDAREGFYVNGDGTPLDLPAKTQALLALYELRPVLPAASQRQLERLSGPWLTGLRGL